MMKSQGLDKSCGDKIGDLCCDIFVIGVFVPLALAISYAGINSGFPL